MKNRLHPALQHTQAQSDLHRDYARQDAGGAEEGAGHRGQWQTARAAVVEACRAAGWGMTEQGLGDF